MTADIKYDQTAKDIPFVDGDLEIVNDQDQTAQAVGIMYRTGYGEWSFNISSGLNDALLRQKGIPDSVTTAEIRRVGTTVPNVLETKEVSVQIDPDTRNSTIESRIETVWGEAELSIT